MNKHMIWNRQLHALIPNNPIVVRDLRHQQRTTSFWRGFIESVGIVAVALAFSAAMVFSVVQELSPGRLRYSSSIQLLAWTFHAVAALRLLTAGVFIVTPDEYLLGSDDLRVTPLSSWQLLFGKWWAAMHRVRGWMVALGIVQLGIVGSIAFGSLMDVSWSSECGGGLPSCIVTIRGLVAPEWFTPTRPLFIVVAAIALAMLETACCTALGIAGTLLARSKLGFIWAISLRFIPVFIFAYFPNYSGEGSPLSRYASYTWFSFADGGTGAIIQMTHPINIVTSAFERGKLGLYAAAGMFLLYISLSLVTAWAVMRRSRR